MRMAGEGGKANWGLKKELSYTSQLSFSLFKLVVHMSVFSTGRKERACVSFILLTSNAHSFSITFKKMSLNLLGKKEWNPQEWNTQEWNPLLHFHSTNENFSYHLDKKETVKCSTWFKKPFSNGNFMRDYKLLFLPDIDTKCFSPLWEN